MLLIASALKGYSIEATDGILGTVKDFLFDDRTWKLKWLVADTGSWLSENKVLVHPSSIQQTDHDRNAIAVDMTKAQVRGSLAIGKDEPVSMQMETHLYDYYGWDPYWGSSYFAAGAMASPLSIPPFFSSAAMAAPAAATAASDKGNPHLRSMAEVAGYTIHATDGVIGHVESFMIDDASWDIRYLVVDTVNWWPGKHVLMSPFAVRDITWIDRQVWLDVDRAKVRSSPNWDPLDFIDQNFEKDLHRHYGWAGYGF